jgi:hypothetical protein
MPAPATRETVSPYRIEPLAKGGAALTGPLTEDTGRTFMFDRAEDAEWWLEWISGAYALGRRAGKEG